MYRLSSVRYGSFSVRVNFRSIISGLSSGMISVRSVRVIRVESLLPGLDLRGNGDGEYALCPRLAPLPSLARLRLGCRAALLINHSCNFKTYLFYFAVYTFCNILPKKKSQHINKETVDQKYNFLF